MLSVVIAAEKADWPVVSTLAALVPAAAAGAVRDVILIDRHRNAAMERIADVAGCHLETFSGSRGAALAAGAALARGPWLMFVAPGAVPEPGWSDEVTRFVEAMDHEGTLRAAIFTAVANPHEAPTLANRLRALGGLLRTDGSALVIRKAFYDALRGHRADADDPERDILRRIGRRNRTTLHARLITPPRIPVEA